MGGAAASREGEELNKALRTDGRTSTDPSTQSNTSLQPAGESAEQHLQLQPNPLPPPVARSSHTAVTKPEGVAVETTAPRVEVDGSILEGVSVHQHLLF